MKLLRLGPPGHEFPGVQTEDGLVDVSAFGEDYDEKFFATNGPRRLREWLQEHAHLCSLVAENTRVAAPLLRPSKIICVGLNYAKHAAESGMDVPAEPVLFFKAPSALSGPFDNIVIPRNSMKTDWEVELAIIIGQRASYVTEEEALNHVAGYALHNDVSERAFQLERLGQWVKGKSADSFAPLGPFIATPDEIPNPQNLNLWLKVNGELMQSSNTSDMVFGVAQLISYISQFMSLLPGDVISTGTPFGVGMGLSPPRYLQAGDVVELGIDGLGVARQTAVAWSG